MPRGGKRGAGGGRDPDRDRDPAVDREVRTRAFWSGTLAFGLVSVPVYLFTAIRRDRPTLRTLAPDGTPLSRRWWCPAEEREVPRDELVRGYEIAPGEHVVVDDEELEELAPEKSREIDLTRFVPAEEVDPRYFQRAYFLTPAGESSKAYRLLALVMESTGRAGIATFVMRGKEYLVAIFAEDGVLRAETLRFAEEIRSPEDVGLPEIDKPARGGVGRFEKAIEELTADELDRSELEDDYADELVAIAERKREKGADVVEFRPAAAAEGEEADETEEGEGGEVVDLLEVIRRSLSGEAGGGGRRPARRASGGRAGKKEKKKAATGGGGKAAARDRKPGTAATELARLTKAELYERARALDLEGRSGMSKDELVDALAASGGQD